MGIDKELKQLKPGDYIIIRCSTPYCSGSGGKCAECVDTWSTCGCLFNEWDCLCGKRVIKE